MATCPLTEPWARSDRPIGHNQPKVVLFDARVRINEPLLLLAVPANRYATSPTFLGCASGHVAREDNGVPRPRLRPPRARTPEDAGHNTRAIRTRHHHSPRISRS